MCGKIIWLYWLFGRTERGRIRDSALNCITKQFFLWSLSWILSGIRSTCIFPQSWMRLMRLQGVLIMLIQCWMEVVKACRPHTVELMATNILILWRVRGRGVASLHTLFNVSTCKGCFCLHRILQRSPKPYVFPPFGMVFPVLSLLKEKQVPVWTCVLPNRIRKILEKLL